MKYGVCMAISMLFASGLVHAGEADVVSVEVDLIGERSFRFDVTVRHADEGWKHYANKWEVTGPDGAVLGTRILHHPHVNEQPFTRSLSGVVIPSDIKEVTIKAYDSVHDDGGKEVRIILPQ